MMRLPFSASSTRKENGGREQNWNRPAWRGRNHRMNSTAIASPEWGHPLLTPEGKEIRVPAFAFEKLRKLGLLAHGRAQLSPMAYQMLDPDYDCITEGLRQLLGGDLTGPKWLVCRCLECQQFEGELDKTLTPAEYQMRRQEELELILQDVKRKRRRTR